MILRAALGAALALALLAAPLAAEAQPPGRVPRIGLLRAGSPPDPYVEVFRQGLRELGYVESQSIGIDVRYARGDPDQLVALAAELVRLKVDVLVTSGLPAIVAAKHATTALPIVFAAASGDPVADGIVISLARPGGNITGLTVGPPELEGKRLELLKQAFPGLSRVAALVNPASVPLKLRMVETAARKLGVVLQVLEVREPGEFEGAFAAMRKGRADALIVLSDALFTNQRTRIVGLAAKSRLPAVYDVRQFPESGGLMSYGPSISDLYRRAAIYVDKILKGAKPADLPIEQPTKFELVINLKTARALGLTIPQSLLLRADEVIQ
jgi:putative ABC transport system substrate-binding protein